MRSAAGRLFVAGLMAIIPGIGKCADRIPVCITSGGNIPAIAVVKAEALTSKMLATAGVAIEWHSAGRSGCKGVEQSLTVNINLEVMSRPSEHPGALAYAELFRGPDIVVMFDRVEQCTKQSSQVASVLAHVMTHEITHILQGTARHSVTGVMKAHWVPQDFDQMEYNPLTFAPEDIELIRTGLAIRAAKHAVAPETTASLLRSADAQ